MILIADSGGSKLDWRILHKDGKIAQAHGPGFNPYYHSAGDLQKSVKENLLPVVGDKVDLIFFYGAGLSSENNIQVVYQTMKGFFPNAKIEINWDLLAAARSLCGQEPGIACILGTGSNSCYYNGIEIAHHVPTLGWILGDEGGGAFLGKRLVNDYIRGELPDKLRNQFFTRFKLEREQILEHVYQKEKPSAFLGSFSKFIFQHLKEPYCYKLVYSSFEEFFQRNVMKYDNYKSVKVHFTGSVAFYYSDILRQVANDMGITVKNIVESPIAGLSLYHQKELKLI